MVVVVDELNSDMEHRYELVWRNMGDFSLVGGCQAADLAAPLGQGPYAHLLKPRRIQGEPVTAEWVNEGVHLRLWTAPQKDQLTYTAQTGICQGQFWGAPVDSVFIRRQGKTTCSVSVMEPYKNNRLLKDLAASSDGKTTTVRLTFADGTVRKLLLPSLSVSEHVIELE